MTTHCEGCTVKKLAIITLVFVMTSGLLSGWSLYASSEKDSEQNSRLTALERDTINIKDGLIITNSKLDELINMTYKTNLLIKIHQAREEVIENE